MGLLLLQFRKMSLLQNKTNMEYQLVDLNQKLMDYQSMSGTLANDSVTMSDLASMPASLFGAGVDSMMMAHNMATQYADQVVANMSNASIFNQYGENSGYMQQLAYMKAYEQGKEQYKKRIQAQLNQKEKEIQLKKTKLEARLACVEEELKGISQRLPEAVSSSVSHFGLQA